MPAGTAGPGVAIVHCEARTDGRTDGCMHAWRHPPERAERRIAHNGVEERGGLDVVEVNGDLSERFVSMSPWRRCEGRAVHEVRRIDYNVRQGWALFHVSLACLEKQA